MPRSPALQMKPADQHRTGTHFWSMPWVYDFWNLEVCQAFVFRALRESTGKEAAVCPTDLSWREMI